MIGSGLFKRRKRGADAPEHGAIVVDDQYRSSVPSVLAVGDVSTRLPLTPVALAEAMVVVDRLFAQASEEAAGEAAPASAMRMLLLLELLYGSGLRASELVSLPRRAVAGERQFLIVRGKGDKERLVPLSDRAREALDRWLPLLADGTSWLFPSGKAHVSRVRLFQMLRELAARAGWSFAVHHTDKPPQLALAALHQALSGSASGSGR